MWEEEGKRKERVINDEEENKREIITWKEEEK